MATIPLRFGVLLRTLRKRAGMTQATWPPPWATAFRPSRRWSKRAACPLVEFVVQQLIPALAVSDAPQMATRLVELAAAARGERPPTSLTIQRSTQVVI